MTEFDWSIRAADDGQTIEGIAVPYGQPSRGQTREYGTTPEVFAQGSFRDIVAQVAAGRRIPIVDEHRGTSVGYADFLEERPEGLYFRGRLLSTSTARDFAEQVAARVVGPSVEFAPGQIMRQAGRVIHQRVRDLGAIAGTYIPAHAGSFAVRHMEGNTVTEPTIDPTPPDAPPVVTPPVSAGPLPLTNDQIMALVQSTADEAFRRYAERGQISRQGGDPYGDLRGYRSLGQLMQAAAADDAPRELHDYAARALADQLTTDSNEGVLTPGVLPEIHGIVSRGRPAITAFGGPRPLTGVGMSVDWAYFDGTLSSLVGVQATQKTAITTAKVEIKKGTEAIRTFAGGSDIAFQLLRRSSPSYLEVYGRILLTAWAVVTDINFVTELETGSVTQDFGEALASHDATEWKNDVIDASIVVETATGQPAEFVLASTTAFTALAKLFTPVTSLAGNTGLGTTDIRSLTVNIGNLPVIHVPSITAGKAIASNREAAGWFEDGPFQIQATDVNLLGQDVAYWSMGVPARFIPGGIVEIYDVSP